MKVLKRVLPVILMIWPYTFVAYLLWVSDIGESIFWPIIAYILATGVVYGVNIINAFLFPRKTKASELALFGMLLKLVHIPFYVFVFIFGMISFGALAIMPGNIITAPIMVLVLFIIDVALMATSSMYSLSAVLKMVFAKEIKIGTAVILGIFSFVFITDIVCSVIIFVKTKNRKKEDC